MSRLRGWRRVNAQGPALRPTLLLIDLLGAVVPAVRRQAWREQWRAELWHYAMWLTREGRGPPSQALYVLARASGAIPHALQLRAIQWSPRMILQDLKFAWRMFVRRPAFTVVAVLILALGIGANTTIFSWTQALLLSPLSGVAGQDRILVVSGVSAARDGLSLSTRTSPTCARRSPMVSPTWWLRLFPMNLRTGDEPMRVFGELVSANFFDFFGVRPLSQRTREIGLRMALGAGRAQVICLVLRDGFTLALVGIAAGMALALVAGCLVAGQLTGVSGADPVSFASTAALLAAVAAVACVLPARRASALNPLTALRRD